MLSFSLSQAPKPQYLPPQQYTPKPVAPPQAPVYKPGNLNKSFLFQE